MACKYYDNRNGKEYNSIQDLIHDFYVNNYTLKNAAIFSADEIQESTMKQLLSVKNINSFGGSDKIPITQYITDPNPMLALLPGFDGKDRLAPQYIKENRIYQYVVDRINELGTVSSDGLDYDDKQLELLKTTGSLVDADESKLIYLLNEIEGIMQHEEKTRDFGTFLHELISAKILDNKNYDSKLSKYITDEKNKEIFGSFSEKEWTNRINSIINNIITKVSKHGNIISEIFISSGKEDHAQVRGKLDLIAVDTNGDAHIFEIKISKTKYTDWDSAKKLTLDWQLALYRQLLGKHIRVDQTRLYVIPVFMSTLANPNNLHLEELEDRKVALGSGLRIDGDIDKKANRLIKKGVFVDYDPDRINGIKNDLNHLIPNFEVKTNLEDINIDDVMLNAKKRFDREGVWRKWNNFKGIEGLEDKAYFEGATEEEFREKAEIYVAHAKSQITRSTSILKDAMISAIKNNQPINTGSFDSQKDITNNHLLKEYLNEEWDVINNIPEASPMGLILLKNRKTGVVNVISLSINQFKAESNIKGKNYGDLEFLKTFLFLNKFRSELLPSSTDKIGEIIVYNPASGDSVYGNAMPKFSEFVDRMHEVNMQDQLKLKESDILGIENAAMYNLDVALRSYSGKDKEDINVIFNLFNNTNLEQIDLDRLLDIQKIFYDKYPSYKEKSLKPDMNFDDEREMLLAMLQVAIITKSQMDLSGDFIGMTKYSLGFSDFKSMLSAIYSKDRAEYDKTGKKIQGIVQGLVWTTPDWVRSADLRNINRIIATTNEHIRQRMLDVSEDINILTTELYSKIGYSKTSQEWIGESQSKYRNMFIQKNGVVSDEFKTKNPYLSDQTNALEPEERTYLKQILLIINQFKLGIPKKEIDKLNANDLDSISKNDKIKSAIEDGSYFEMPLVRREELSKHEGTSMYDLYKRYSNEMNDFLDTRELTKDDLETVKLQKMGFYEMYDVYGKQTPEYKARVIEKYKVNYFEFNLDTIAHRLVFNKIRKEAFDRKLPIINSYIWWMKLLGGKQNDDISKQLEYIANQLNLAAYDEPIIDDEFKDLATVVSFVKPISTMGMLAFKPISLIKEMTIGVMKGATLASTQIYGKDQFTIKDLSSAYGKLMSIDKKFASEFNLIGKMNIFYGFANMDMSSVSKKLQTDRRGIFRGVGRWMYASNTVPDYYNRLSLWLAKMIHDGSYEAHSNKGGKFIYDPTKDKRFSHYLANRENYKDSQGRYIPKNGDNVYNTQRNHYLLLMNQLNDEYVGEDFKPLTESDMIHKAYSSKERSSFKTFTDMVYGAYDKDAQSQAGNTWWGITYLQFMQFWPGKMKMWFATPISEEDVKNDPNASPMGKFEQEFRKDADGNKILLWKKPVLDENGDYTYDGKDIVFEPTEENTSDPLLKWTGTAYEGLAYSVLYTIQDLARMDFKSIRNNTERRNRVMFALSDAAMMFIMLGVIKALLDGIIAENGTDGIDGELLKFGAALDKKVLNEYNLYQSTLGAINTEPAFVSWGKKVGTDMMSVVNGNKTLTEAMGRDVGALEFLKEYQAPKE